MDPLTGALVAGGISAGAGLLGNLVSGNASAKEADTNRAYQERLSNTSHRREVDDLRDAGLNPILSAAGSGASTPSGSMASFPDAGPSLAKGVESAIAVRQQNAELRGIEANIGNTTQDTQNKKVNNVLMQQQAASTAKDVDAKTMQNSVLKNTLPAMIKKANAEGDYSELNQIMGVINSGASSANQLLNPLKGMITIPTGKKK